MCTPEKYGSFGGADYMQVIFKTWTENQHQYVRKPSLKMWNFLSINTSTAQSEQSLVCSHCQWRPSQVRAQDPPARIWWWGSGQPSSLSGWGQGRVLAEADMRAWSDQTECGTGSQRHSANASHGRYLGKEKKKKKKKRKLCTANPTLFQAMLLFFMIRMYVTEMLQRDIKILSGYFSVNKS